MSAESQKDDLHVPAGGPATINGVVYQMLWSLVRASRAHLSMSKSDGTGQIEKILLKLEPVGGGGDLVVTEGGQTVVEQLKARPDGGPWSLREIVEAVLPDLYVACGASAEDTDFRFVTEGRMGHWGSALKLSFPFCESASGGDVRCVLR